MILVASVLTACKNSIQEQTIIVHSYPIGLQTATQEEVFFGTLKITNRYELQNFMLKQQDNFDFNLVFEYDTFANAMLKYDDSFFDNNILAIHGALIKPLRGLTYKVHSEIINGVLHILLQRFYQYEYVTWEHKWYIYLVEICNKNIDIIHVDIGVTRGIQL